VSFEFVPPKSEAAAAQLWATIGALEPLRLFDGLDDDPETRKLVAAMVATEQCRHLSAEGVDSFHFYTLNRADLTLGICRSLGLKPAPVAALAGGLAAETPPLAVDPSMA